MTQRLLSCCLLLALLSSSGCLFSRKSRPPRENAAIASEVEESLKKRWIEKRSSELIAQGTAAGAAQAQALQEFREKFEYTGAARK